MSKSQTHANQSIAPESADTADLVEVVQQLADEVADLRDDVADLEAENKSLRDDVAELEADLEAERDRRGREVAETRKSVSDLREKVEEGGSSRSNPTPNGGETTLQPDDLTPIEQIAQADDVEAVTDSPSVQRAVTLFQNLDDWGQKAPKGITLKPSDNPLSLLEAACDESLCWKQWYRAAETLEQLSQGAVTFFDSDRHGKMVCLHKQSEVHDRVRKGGLSPSSVATTP